MTPLVVASFVRQRVSNLMRKRAEGASLGYWLASGVGRYASAYARELERQGAATATPATPAAAAELTQSLSASKKLNFGCGYDHRPGFVNVDSDPACKPDVLISHESGPDFPRNFYENIVAKDVLEHIPRLSSLRMLLQFNDWLADGGQLELQTSSILGVADLIRSKNDFGHHFGMVNCLFGSQMHPGDFHFTGFTETTLKVLLLASHFSFGDFSLVDGWMFKLEARRVKPWFPWADDARELSESKFMSEVFQQALGREANGHESTAFADLLARGSRRAAALEIFSSPERLLMMARVHGY